MKLLGYLIFWGAVIGIHIVFPFLILIELVLFGLGILSVASLNSDEEIT